MKKKSRMSGIQRDGVRVPMTPKELREYSDYGESVAGDPCHDNRCVVVILRLHSEVRALRRINKKLIKLIDEALDNHPFPISANLHSRMIDYLYRSDE